LSKCSRCFLFVILITQLKLGVKKVNEHENTDETIAPLFWFAAGVFQFSESHKPAMVCSVI